MTYPNFGKYQSMNMAELCVEAGLRPAHITKKTYIYVDEKGQLTHTEKVNADTTPGDEIDSFGYAVTWWEGDLKGLREEVARLLLQQS